MAETSYPLPPNRIILDAEYEKLVGITTPSGWIGSVGDLPIVYADSSGMLVRVRADKQVLTRGFMWESGDTEFTRAIAANVSGSTRIDLVVVRLTRATWTCSIQVRQGVPGAGAPEPVTNTVGGVYEIPIATVTVVNNAPTITASSVTSVAWLVGNGGVFRCVSLYRPPLVAGRVIYETDTGRSMLCTGTTWKVLYEDTGWVNCTVSSGWTTSPTGGVRVRRINQLVTLELDLFRSGSSLAAGGSLVVVGRLPNSSFYPSGRPVLQLGSINVAGGSARFGVSPSGQSTAGQIDISYYTAIASGKAISLVTSWPVG